MHFELVELSAKLWPYTRQKRWVAIGGVAFLTVFGSFYVLAAVPRMEHGTVSSFDWFGLAVILSCVLFGGIELAPMIPRLRRGAILLTIDDLGFELAYPEGQSVRTEWSDPRLCFDLIDLSGANPTRLLTGEPYSISVRGVRFNITRAAYLEMVPHVARSHLNDAQVRGSRWWFPSDSTPVIHTIRSSK